MSQFSNVRLTILREPKGPVVALGSVKVGDCIWLTGIRVVNGATGQFVGLPKQKNGKGEYQDIYYPSSKAVRDELSKIIMGEYKRQLGDGTAPSPAPAAGSDPSNF